MKNLIQLTFIGVLFASFVSAQTWSQPVREVEKEETLSTESVRTLEFRPGLSVLHHESAGLNPSLILQPSVTMWNGFRRERFW